MQKKYGIKLAGLVVGAVLGFVYQHYWGCTTGCAIRSSAPLMTLFGAIMGYLVVDIVEDWRG